jgi:uncharacterized protein YggE
MRTWLLLAGCVFAGASLRAQTSTVPQVVTTGVGEASAAPDRASIYIGVQTRATTAQAASTDNARRVKAVMDTIRAMGIPQGQIQTANYSVQPEMAYPNGQTQPPRAVAYTVTNSVVVRLNRIDDVGRVIDAALAKGANEISSLQFTSSKADSMRAVALAAAVADARAQAESMAKAAGGTLGTLLELNTSSVPIRPMPVMASFAMRAGPPTPISPGDQTVSATVTARWTFVAGR